MSNTPNSAIVQEPPKHRLYVSLHNGSIHPAMTSPSGWEDNNLTDWRPATPQEVARYDAGDQQTVDVSPVNVMDVGGPVGAPATLRLADDDVPEAPTVAAASVPAPTIAPAPAPAPAIAPAPVIPPAATE